MWSTIPNSPSNPILTTSASFPSTISGTFPKSAPFSASQMLKSWSMPSSPPGWITVTHFSLGLLARTCWSSNTSKTLQLGPSSKCANTTTSLHPSPLHRLPFSVRIDYKVSLLTDQFIHRHAPRTSKIFSNHKAPNSHSNLLHIQSLCNAPLDTLRAPQSTVCFKKDSRHSFLTRLLFLHLRLFFIL